MPPSGSPYRRVNNAVATAAGGPETVETHYGPNKVLNSQVRARAHGSYGVDDEEVEGPQTSGVRALEVWYWTEDGNFVPETLYMNGEDAERGAQGPRLIVSLNSFEALAQAYVQVVEKEGIKAALLKDQEALLAKLRVAYFKEARHLRELLEMARQQLEWANGGRLVTQRKKMEDFERIVRETEVYYLNIIDYLEPDLKAIMQDAVKQFNRDLMRENFELKDQLALLGGGVADESLAERLFTLLLSKGISPAKLVRTLVNMITDKKQSDDVRAEMMRLLGIAQRDLEELAATQQRKAAVGVGDELSSTRENENLGEGTAGLRGQHLSSSFVCARCGKQGGSEEDNSDFAAQLAAAVRDAVAKAQREAAAELAAFKQQAEAQLAAALLEARREAAKELAAHKQKFEAQLAAAKKEAQQAQAQTAPTPPISSTGGGQPPTPGATGSGPEGRGDQGPPGPARSGRRAGGRPQAAGRGASGGPAEGGSASAAGKNANTSDGVDRSAEIAELEEQLRQARETIAKLASMNQEEVRGLSKKSATSREGAQDLNGSGRLNRTIDSSHDQKATGITRYKPMELLDRDFDDSLRGGEYSIKYGKPIKMVEEELERERKRRIDLESTKRKLEEEVKALSAQRVALSQEVDHTTVELKDAKTKLQDLIEQDASDGRNEVTIFCRWLIKRYGGLEQGFRALDLDNSGQMSFHEFCKGLTSMGWLKVVGRKLFRLFDPKETGSMTYDQLLEVYKRWVAGQAEDPETAAKLARAMEDAKESVLDHQHMEQYKKRCRALEEEKTELMKENVKLTRQLAREGKAGNLLHFYDSKERGMERKVDAMRSGIESLKAENEALMSKMTAAMWKCREAQILHVRLKREAEDKGIEFDRLNRKFELFKAKYKQPFADVASWATEGGTGGAAGPTWAADGSPERTVRPRLGDRRMTSPGRASSPGATVDFGNSAAGLSIILCEALADQEGEDGELTRPASADSPQGGLALVGSPTACPRCGAALRLAARPPTGLSNNAIEDEAYRSDELSPEELVARMTDEELLYGAPLLGGAPGDARGLRVFGEGLAAQVPYRARIAARMEGGHRSRFELLFMDSQDRRRGQSPPPGPAAPPPMSAVLSQQSHELLEHARKVHLLWREAVPIDKVLPVAAASPRQREEGAADAPGWPQSRLLKGAATAVPARMGRVVIVGEHQAPPPAVLPEVPALTAVRAAGAPAGPAVELDVGLAKSSLGAARAQQAAGPFREAPQTPPRVATPPDRPLPAPPVSIFSPGGPSGGGQPGAAPAAAAAPEAGTGNAPEVHPVTLLFDGQGEDPPGKPRQRGRANVVGMWRGHPHSQADSSADAPGWEIGSGLPPPPITAGGASRASLAGGGGRSRVPPGSGRRAPTQLPQLPVGSDPGKRRPGSGASGDAAALGIRAVASMPDLAVAPLQPQVLQQPIGSRSRKGSQAMPAEGRVLLPAPPTQVRVLLPASGEAVQAPSVGDGAGDGPQSEVPMLYVGQPPPATFNAGVQRPLGGSGASRTQPIPAARRHQMMMVAGALALGNHVQRHAAAVGDEDDRGPAVVCRSINIPAAE